MHPLLVPRLRKSGIYTFSHPKVPLWSVTGPLYLLHIMQLLSVQFSPATCYFKSCLSTLFSITVYLHFSPSAGDQPILTLQQACFYNFPVILQSAWQLVSVLSEADHQAKLFLAAVGYTHTAVCCCFLHYKNRPGLSSQVHIGEGVSGCNTRKIYTSQPPPPSSSPSHGEDVTWPPPVVSDCSRSRILTEIFILRVSASQSIFILFYITFMLTSVQTVQTRGEESICTQKLRPVYRHMF
jgi:hypothetical protein